MAAQPEQPHNDTLCRLSLDVALLLVPVGLSHESVLLADLFLLGVADFLCLGSLLGHSFCKELLDDRLQVLELL